MAIATITNPTLYLVDRYLPVDHATNRYMRITIGIIACTAMFYLLIRFLLATADRRRAIRGNLCPTCSYDLRAHNPGQRCPECGAQIPCPSTPSKS
jgi:hypothetical protein